jgi:cytochrome c-type biogenesis protein CcmH
MIRSMVERLDQRLTSDGSDVDGWARLMRAYQVMGENDKAKTALERARKALEDNAEALQKVEQSATELGLK